MKAALIYASLVGCGGFIGAILRFVLGGLVQRNVPVTVFPYGTLAVNLVGCLLIGMVMGLIESRQMFTVEARLFVVAGLLGGFTTYSTFGYESFMLLRDAEYFRAAANVLLHVILGLGLVWLGYLLTAR